MHHPDKLPPLNLRKAKRDTLVNRFQYQSMSHFLAFTITMLQRYNKFSELQ